MLVKFSDGTTLVGNTKEEAVQKMHEYGYHFVRNLRADYFLGHKLENDNKYHFYYQNTRVYGNDICKSILTATIEE